MLPLFSKVGCNFHEQLKNTVKKISALSDFFSFFVFNTISHKKRNIFHKGKFETDKIMAD